MTKKMNNLRVPYGLAVHGKEEEQAVIEVIKEKRTILGKETYEFEKNIAKLFGKKYGIMVNSGSSANYLAIELLNIPKNFEVITPILTFSTTLGPIVKNGLIPVFVDVEEGTYVVNVEQVEKSITKKTKALFVPLLLGNVPNLKKLKAIAKKNNLYFIEDSCDTLGAVFENKMSGEYSDISTTSFYGSHIITAGGGGGMLMVNNIEWQNKAKVLRGWGRGSALLGESEDPKIRYKGKIGGIPYDAKFIFNEIGYNYLPMEMGSAFGNAQLKKLSKFKKIRDRNFKELLNIFSKLEKYFILPKQYKETDTQWLAFPLVIKKDSPFTRIDIVNYLEKNNIQTRPILTGVVTEQPGFKNIIYKSKYKEFPIAKDIMERGFMIGCHQGLGKAHLSKIQIVFNSFFQIS